jgi:hypothetical protein
MKPQTIVATILALIVLLFVIGSFSIRVITDDVNYMDRPEAVIAWKDILMTIVGGLIAYIGMAGKGDKDG